MSPGISLQNVSLHVRVRVRTLDLGLYRQLRLWAVPFNSARRRQTGPRTITTGPPPRKFPDKMGLRAKPEPGRRSAGRRSDRGSQERTSVFAGSPVAAVKSAPAVPALRRDGMGATADEADWRTPAEAADYRRTPDYATTLAYLGRLAAAHRGQVRIEEFGRTGEGRALSIVVLSGDGVFDPTAIHASGRAVLLIQNAIHAGEMDGKDACLALARDLLREPGAASLLDHVVPVIIPVYNIDGHERWSEYHRINQNGPERMGWRANGTNLNLNRDYMKTDAPETRAFFRLFRRWEPDFFVDNHVTDGADFQYDVTFVLDATPDVAPATAEWIRSRVTPELVRGVRELGHLAFPGGIFLNDDTDPAQGLDFYENPPRFSTGHMILEGRPGLLVELHMLKDYRTRVTGDYAILRTLLRILERDHARLLELNREADRAAIALGADSGSVAPFPLTIAKGNDVTPTEFLGYRFVRAASPVSGAMAIEYTHEPWNVTLPRSTGARVIASVRPPAGYIVPAPWKSVIEVLEAHGVALRTTRRAWTGRVEQYRLSGMRWSGGPFEGRHPILRASAVDAERGGFGTISSSIGTRTFPAGSAVVTVRQRLARFVIHWLEPEGPDSAVRWGFFDSIFETKEHGEAYVVERLAREALAEDPDLKVEFERRLADDPAFAADPAARLAFFFDRSPWGRANRVGEYPVGRLASLDGLPVEPFFS